MKNKRLPLNIQLFAEEGTDPVTQTAVKTEAIVTESIQKADTNVKTFTQEEVNAMLAKEKRKMPSEDELKAFNNWKESQKTDEEKQNEKDKQIETLNAELNAYKNLSKVESAGVDKKFAKFVLSEISDKDGEIEDLVKDYVKENPQFLVSKRETKTTGFSQNNISQIKSEEQAYLDKKYAQNPYYKQK